MNFDRLAIIVLIIFVFYLAFIKKENMSNTDVKKMISDIYQADIQSIRNLSKLANDLTSNGKLRIPGGLEVDGGISWHKGKGRLVAHPGDGANIELDNMQGKRGIHMFANYGNNGARFWVHDKQGNRNIDFFNKDMYINGKSTFNGPTNFKNQKTGQMTHLNQPDGNIYLRGNVIMDGHGNSGKDLHVHGTSHLAIRDGQAKVHIDAPGKNGRIITHGANKKQIALIDRAHQGGRILVKNDVTDRWVTGIESHNFGGVVLVNHRDGHHRIHLNGHGDRSEINFSPHKTAKLEAHNQRLAMRANHQAYFNNDHHRIRYLHHNCQLGAGGRGHARETSC